jgi:uncharacterized protein RhaS with RHS repeats
VTSDPIGIEGDINTYSYVGNNPFGYTDKLGLTGSPGLGDQANPFGMRGPGYVDYTDYFNSRFPRTISGSKVLMKQRIKKKICARKFDGPTKIGGLTGGAEDIDISPDMQRFGDTPQNLYEENVQIGKFEIKTDPIYVNWKQCSFCFTYSTTMFVLENTGENWFGPGFRERPVRMGNWALRGEGCCD